VVTNDLINFDGAMLVMICYQHINVVCRLC